MKQKCRSCSEYQRKKSVDYRALLGDSVDNIPGAKGIGEKGAAELIQKYGKVETALDHAR